VPIATFGHYQAGPITVATGADDFTEPVATKCHSSNGNWLHRARCYWGSFQMHGIKLLSHLAYYTSCPPSYKDTLVWLVRRCLTVYCSTRSSFCSQCMSIGTRACTRAHWHAAAVGRSIWWIRLCWQYFLCREVKGWHAIFSHKYYSSNGCVVRCYWGSQWQWAEDFIAPVATVIFIVLGILPFKNYL
jgi:hypothetical protein